MKAFLEQIDTDVNSSVKVKTYVQSLIDVPLHYHPQHEIVYIQKGNGSLIVADIEEAFEEGDLFFINGNVPHLFQDDSLNAGKVMKSKVVVVQYSQLLFGQFFSIPEFDLINKFEKNVRYGLKLPATAGMRTLIQKLVDAGGLARFNLLTELLTAIIGHKEKQYFSNLTGRSPSNLISYIRLQKINAYILEYSDRDISIEDVASVVHLNKTSFCRFLRRETGKTFSEHINYFRINHACKLLRESEKGILEICYATGFNNPAYFFRQFKKLKGSTPAVYRETNF